MLIHDYAEDGNVTGVADELGRSAGIEDRDRCCGYTPLMHAVTSAKAGADMVRFLLERSANPNAVHHESENIQASVLGLAVRTANRDKIVLLLDAGADINYEQPKGYVVLIDVMFRRDVARDPELVPILQLLIDRGAKLNAKTEYGESALSVASNNGRFDAVGVLLDAGSDPSPLAWTPLMRAIALGSLADVRSQLGRGANLAARDYWNRTPWLLSLQVGDVEKANLLLAAGANLEDRERRGKPPLMYPIANGHVGMLRWLLSKGLNPDSVDDFARTALMEAASQGATECVTVLLDAGAKTHLANRHDDNAIALASNLHVVRLLVNAGADLNDMNDDMRAALTKLPHDGRLYVSREEYLATKHRRFGKSNPEMMNYPFWMSMVKAGSSAYSARDYYNDVDLNDEPVWCFMRFGKSITELPDGRIIEIAGEHEDYYDPDFCIYNDVIVHHGDGTFDILGYPKEVFPPTDFHTATLVEKFIYIVGSLGYQSEPRYDATQVYRLDTETLAMEAVLTSGRGPGWISRHRATLRGNHEIHIRGGKLCNWKSGAEEYVDNPAEYVLSLDTLEWHKTSAGE